MNEQIKQLMGQTLDEKFSGTWSTMDMLDLQKFAERFAELIVAECLGIVDDVERGGSNEIWDNAVKFIRRDLQEHFGVKE